MHISDPERARRTGVAVYLYLFDLVYVDGHDLRPLANRARKRVLRRAFSFGGPIRFLTHRNREGEAMYAEACRRGLEGVIAKRAAGTYTGKRSGDWLKFKCGHEQELVIGGFTSPHGSRTDFGALLVGYYEGGRLIYAGKVGRGSPQDAGALGRRLREHEIDDSPFEDVDPVPRGTHWVRPELVGSSASPNGPATGACATRTTWGCETTSRRVRSFANGPPISRLARGYGHSGVRRRDRMPGSGRERTWREAGWLARSRAWSSRFGL